MSRGEFTHSEVSSQPEVWSLTLDKTLAKQDELKRDLAGLAHRPCIVTGCGSTYYLSLAAASVLRAVGTQAMALPASELAFFPQSYLPRDFVLLAISRSGTTTETLWAIDTYRKQHPSGKVVVITCYPDTPMVEKADVALTAPDAQEQSIAQTRSFTSMGVLVQVLAGLWTQDSARLQRLRRLPETLTYLFRQAGDLPQKLGTDLSLQRFFFLGHGPLYGIACEAMLKTKEMTCSWAEAYHPLEFRHGPMSVVDGSSLVVGLLSDSATEAEIKVLQHMQQLGARTLALTATKDNRDWKGVDHVIELNSDLNEWERGVLYLPLIQMMAYHRALAKGLDPDQPVNLTAVVQL